VLEGDHEREVFRLLPVACAASFAAPSWSSAAGAFYIAEDDLFESNHHCIPLAVASLFAVYLGADIVVPGAGAGRVADAYDPVVAQERVEAPLRLLRHLSAEYLYVSAQLLLTMKHASIGIAERAAADGGASAAALAAAAQRAKRELSDVEKGFVDRPLGAMFPLLGRFVEYSASTEACDESLLQAVLPHALVHHAVVDVSLGKLYGDDKRGSFRHTAKKEIVV